MTNVPIAPIDGVPAELIQILNDRFRRNTLSSGAVNASRNGAAGGAGAPGAAGISGSFQLEDLA